MFYFIKEGIKISKEDLNNWLINMDLYQLEKFRSSFDIEEVIKKDQVYIFKNMVYFAVEISNIKLLKKLINEGYFVKIKNNVNNEEINFRNIPSGFISHLGLFFNKEIFDYLLEDVKKINIFNAIKLAYKTNYSLLGKIKSFLNIYVKNNTKINIHDTEIIHRIIEKEDLHTLMNISIDYLKDSKSIYYYLSSVKNKDLIKYVFSLKLRGDTFYNHLALSSLINNTEKFKYFYSNIEKMKVDSVIIAQIIEEENIELLDFLYLNDNLKIKYDENIFKDIIFHSIYKEKLQSLKCLLKYWEYDFSDIKYVLKIYGKNINNELLQYIENYQKNLALKNKLESKIINNKNERKKVEKI